MGRCSGSKVCLSGAIQKLTAASVRSQYQHHSSSSTQAGSELWPWWICDGCFTLGTGHQQINWCPGSVALVLRTAVDGADQACSHVAYGLTCCAIMCVLGTQPHVLSSLPPSTGAGFPYLPFVDRDGVGEINGSEWGDLSQHTSCCTDRSNPKRPGIGYTIPCAIRSLPPSRSRSTSRSGGAPKSFLYSRLKYEASSYPTR